MRSRGVLGLDLIRFSAALSVAIYHLAYWDWREGAEYIRFRDGLGFLSHFARWGWVGVPIFFVLSGFVIAFSGETKLPAEFAKGRFLRLYPGAWICATFTMILARWGDPGVFGDYLRAILLWPLGPWIDNVYWTIAVEMVFYTLTFAFITCRWPIVRLGYAFALVSGTFWLTRAALFLLAPDLKWLFTWAETPLGGLTMITHGCQFAIGILFYSIWRHGFSLPKAAAACVAMLASLVSLVSSGRFCVEAYGGEAWQALEPAALWAFAVCLIGIAVRWNDAVSEVMGKWRNPIRTVGLLTYPLYLLHYEIGRVIMIRTANIGAVAAFLLALVGVFGLAIVALHLEDRVRRVFSRPPQRTVAAA